MVTHQSLCRLVLEWIKRQICEDQFGMTQLLERSHMLYLALDNSLQDCSNLPPGHESESDLVQDYKRLVLKCPSNTNRRRKQMGVPGRPRVLIYSRDIGQRDDEQSQFEPDWNLLGSIKVADNTFLSLVTINGMLTRVSVQLRLNLPPTTPSPVAPESAGTVLQTQLCRSNTSSNGSINGDIEINQEPELFCEVATMSGPKCGLGVAELNGKLLVCTFKEKKKKQMKFNYFSLGANLVLIRFYFCIISNRYAAVMIVVNACEVLSLMTQS